MHKAFLEDVRNVMKTVRYTNKFETAETNSLKKENEVNKDI